MYKSNNIPVSGTSVGLIILRICSMDCKSGERPITTKKAITLMIPWLIGAWTNGATLYNYYW